MYINEVQYNTSQYPYLAVAGKSFTKSCDPHYLVCEGNADSELFTKMVQSPDD